MGLRDWQPPQVMAWETWVSTLWQRLVVEGHATTMVLNRSQEHAVWRTVLKADEELTSLQLVDSLAEMVSEAWHLICSYDGIDRLRGAAGGSADTRSFQRWAVTFDRLCKAEDFCSQSQIEQLLRRFVEAGAVGLPAGGVLLIGFDALNPAQSGLVDAIRHAGGLVAELRRKGNAGARLLAAAQDGATELYAAALWVRSYFEQQPAGRVAVIVPNIEADRSEIDRVFREVLAPELDDIRVSSANAPYEFSAGKSLAEAPMVEVALDLLRWATEALPLARVSALLLSRYFAMAGEERGARAEFDAFELRHLRMLRPELSVDDLIGAVERSKRRQKISRLSAVLKRMRAVSHRLHGLDARSYSEWAEHMHEFLEAAAWGEASGESSFAFQVRRKWESALDEMATLDFDGVAVEFAQALAAIERIARNTMFAPESHDAPVQVIGPLEAAGSTFDAVWFLRAGEMQWPLTREPNPLLPWHLQRQLKMPGTEIAHDSDFARRVTERIAESASTVVFSYARETEGGRQRPSSVLSELHLELIEAEQLGGVAAARSVVALEEVEDAAPVRQLPNQMVRGGARVLELQAACGFRAFAEQRLWATELSSREPGMNARESGTLIHKVLEIFWSEVKTQQTLIAMTAEEREDMLDWCISGALRRTGEASTDSWEVAYVALQRERLGRLLRSWLEVEIARGVPFEVRLSEKEFKNVLVGPLRLSVRMDRVDVVEGGEVLIDYKTGVASPGDWLTDRPDAPQLPLYAILAPAEQLQGVAFGLVRAGDACALRGYQAVDGVLPNAVKLKEAATLEAQIERWRDVLVRLAEEFHRGDARVRPKRYPGTCERCAHRLLCRLDASSLQAGADDEVAVGADRV